MDALRYELIQAVVATAGVLLRESEQLFRPQGLTAAQFNVLSALAPEREGITQRELSDVLVVDRSNVTGLIDRMSRRGWVRRRDDPRDRRVYRVALTPAGRRVWEQASQAYGEAVARVTAEIKDRPARTTLRALENLRRQAAAWRPAPAGRAG